VLTFAALHWLQADRSLGSLLLVHYAAAVRHHYKGRDGKMDIVLIIIQVEVSMGVAELEYTVSCNFM
jgi:hypothetical protein